MTYKFEKIDKIVKIVPLVSVFSKMTVKRLKQEALPNMAPNMCHMNCYGLALWFKDHGIKVDIVQGYITLNERAPFLAARMGVKLESDKPHLKGNAPVMHSFLRFNGKYFDPTIETLFGMNMVSAYDYTAKRVFDYDTLNEYVRMQCSKFNHVIFTDTLEGISYRYRGAEEITLDWGHLDNEGNYVEPKTDPMAVIKELEIAS